MIRRNYQLEDTVLKASEDMVLWQTEKGLLKISKNTLVLPIRLDGQRKGYVFHGQAQLLLDTIVETEEGAIGKSVEKEISRSFLMFGAKEEIGRHLNQALKEDLEKAEYHDEQEFRADAERICDQFMGRRRSFDCDNLGISGELVVAFSNETGNLDILVNKGSKLVYKAAGIVFVSSKGESILKGQDTVVLSHNGKSFVVRE
jgi:hypothetical protein